MADVSESYEVELNELKKEIENLKVQKDFLLTKIEVLNQDLFRLNGENADVKTGNFMLQKEIQKLNSEKEKDDEKRA